MNRKQRWHLLLTLAGILLLFAVFPAVAPALDVSAQTIPTITPTPDPSNPTATSPPANPTATSRPANPTATARPANPTATARPANPTATARPANPTATARPANPTATSGPANPTATGNSASPTASRTPRATATPGAGTPSATADASGTALPSLTPSTDATATASGASGSDGIDGLDGETEPGLATASPIPGRPDDAQSPDDVIGDDTDGTAPLPGEESEGSGLGWVFLLGTGLVVAAGVLFFVGRRAE